MTALVEFMDLACEDTEDLSTDQIYIRYAGAKIYPKDVDYVSMSKGDTRNLRGITYPVDGAPAVALFDADWPDADDSLGEHQVREDQVGQGVQTALFEGHGARYTLTYHVEPKEFELDSAAASPGKTVS